ncbi:hypothetical protein LPJ66_001161 [Kickxella alabastrina]|uniref:Uncharacterized protein n=1 Tax=Kickxella alabastrina TaxID=61397 RepID=A0ACC1IUD2_9FUNG|nr:hypothetical protein LPJ66_001161 [Kickxella alabastrina]
MTFRLEAAIHKARSILRLPVIDSHIITTSAAATTSAVAATTAVTTSTSATSATVTSTAATSTTTATMPRKRNVLHLFYCAAFKLDSNSDTSTANNDYANSETKSESDTVNSNRAFSGLQAALANKTAACLVVETNFAKATHTLSQLQPEKALYKVGCYIAQTTCAGMKDKNTALSTKADTLQAELALSRSQAETEIARLTAQLHQKEEFISSFEMVKAAITEWADLATQQLAFLNKRRDELNSELARAGEQNTAMRSEVLRLDEKLEDMTRVASKLNAEPMVERKQHRDNVIGKLDADKQWNQQLEQRVEELDHCYKQNTADIDVIFGELLRLRGRKFVDFYSLAMSCSMKMWV